MDQHHLETGVQIGDFQIESRLGAGGMGIVYRARQVSLDRVVALKILGSALTRGTDLARFRREAQMIAKLDHPSIAGVHFIGQDRHVCYMAMEFIDGAPLRSVLDRPAGILVLSFAHFLTAAFSFLLILTMTASRYLQVPPPTVPQEPLSTFVWNAVVHPLLYLSYCLAIGFGLLAGHRWARWVSIAAASLLVAWSLYEVMNERSLPGLIVGAVILAIPVAVIVYLMRRSVRDWFRLAARLRAEHRRPR
jgi:hypothetical protein